MRQNLEKLIVDYNSAETEEEKNKALSGIGALFLTKVNTVKIKSKEVTVKRLIEFLRKEKKITYREMGEKTGKSLYNIATKIKRGSVSVSTLIELLQSLDEELVITLNNGNTFKIKS